MGTHLNRTAGANSIAPDRDAPAQQIKVADSQFADSRRFAVSSARTLFRGLSAEEQQRKVSAVEDAFDQVGIS